MTDHEQVIESSMQTIQFLERVEQENLESGTRSRVKLGQSALNGFEPMCAVESPFGERLRSELEDAIVDQPEAINAIVDAVDRLEVRLPGDKRPIASLAFLGPTGVGKSQTAKSLSHIIGGGSGNLIKVDCSNYSQGHEVSMLTGAPPSYVGREQVPLLNKDAVEDEAGTVILFDEVEKGSPKLYDLMLQIMGDGELRLANGDNVSFDKTIVILTSNLGAREMSRQLSPTPLGFGNRKNSSDKTSLEKIATKEFEDFFRPEFINRLTQMVVFHQLSEDGLRKVLATELTKANQTFEEMMGVNVALSEGCQDHIIAQTMEQPHLGARPLIRLLDKQIYSEFGRHSASGNVEEGTEIMVFHEQEVPKSLRTDVQGELVFASKRNPFLRKKVVPTPLALPAYKAPEDHQPDPEPSELVDDSDPDSDVDDKDT